MFLVVTEITKTIELSLNNCSLTQATLKDILKGFSSKIKAITVILKLILVSVLLGFLQFWRHPYYEPTIVGHDRYLDDSYIASCLYALPYR